MKIAYLHGLESTIDPKDPKIIWLNNNFKEVYTPQINYKDDSTFDRLYKDIKSLNPDIIVGSSMGGYVSYLIGRKLSIPVLLFNPAVVGRSFDPVVDDSNLKRTKIDVMFGKSDTVINGKAVRKYFRDNGVAFNHSGYDGGHRVPEDVFINSIKGLTGISEIHNEQNNIKMMKHVKLFEQFIAEKREDASATAYSKSYINKFDKLVSESVVTEGREANQFGIESQHIGKLQKGKMSKYTEGSSMPFGLISRPESGLSDTDRNLVKDYVNADNIVLGFYPMEDSNNDTMYDAVNAGGIKVIEDLVSKEYGLKLTKTIKGKRHCAGDTCSLMHYLVFSKA